MDYKIKFEYKGMGKQASGIRQSVLQSQKSAAQKAGTGGGSDRETVSNLKALNSSIQKLIASNNALAKSNSSRGSGGASSGSGGSGFGGSAGIGRIGATIPIAGAMVAMGGFLMQKISQIGNSYIQLVSQQKGSVGTGGFRSGQGMYLSGEMGAGMKAYASKTGQFAPKKTVKPDKGALDVGAIYGLSAQEVLGQAGTFKRSGADYGNVAAQAMGGGIQTELPTLLSGMAGMMEESIRAGLDASEMSKDLGKNLTELTKSSGSKSVDAALGIVKSFKGTQSEVGSGKFGTLGGLYTAQASRKILMQKITGEGKEKYLQDLQDKNIISNGQREKMASMKPGASFQDLQNTLGGSAAFFLEKRNTRKMAGSAALQNETMKLIGKTYGTDAEGMQKAANVFSASGSVLGGSEDNFATAFNVAAGKKKPITPETTKKGAGMLSKGAEGVIKSDPGKGTFQKQSREGMQIQFGQKFAEMTLKMERSMADMAKRNSGTINTMISGLETTVDGAGAAFRKIATITNEVADVMKKAKEKIEKINKKSEKITNLMKKAGADTATGNMYTN